MPFLFKQDNTVPNHKRIETTFQKKKKERNDLKEIKDTPPTYDEHYSRQEKPKP